MTDRERLVAMVGEETLRDLESLSDRTCGSYGPWHIVLSDGNIEDDWVRACMAHEDEDDVLDASDMQRIGNALLALPEDDRMALLEWLRSDAWWNLTGREARDA